MKLGYKTAWLLLTLVVLTAFIFIFVPVWLIQPFAPQTARKIEVSYFLKSWSPIATVVLAVPAIDAETGSKWDFSGLAVSGELAGSQLDKITVLKDYWFVLEDLQPRNATLCSLIR